jgi:CheY-like chemotaxis protein
MAIYRLLQNSPLGPEDINRVTAAYEQTLQALALKDRNDPITEIVAKKIIEIAQTGVHDPAEISRTAVAQLSGRLRVLIVEDEYILANDLEIALKSHGMEVVGPVGHLDEALARLADGGFDVAVIDIGLHGQQAFDVTDWLQREGIPFVFATGYGAETIPLRFAEVIRWEKPYDLATAALDLVRLCHRHISPASRAS